MSKLGLGTVQWGKEYGIANTVGPPQQKELAKILNYAANQGVEILDTAPTYGNSEEILGRLISKERLPFNIITKTQPFQKNTLEKIEMDVIEKTFHQSLKHLQQETIYGLLVHQVADLQTPSGVDLYQMLLRLKNKGIVQKIGISIYYERDLKLLDTFAFDLIQLPINILDQRFLSQGYLKRLKHSHIEIHARSIFLQGLLLMPLAKVPNYFFPVINYLEKFHKFIAEKKLSQLEAALSFVMNRPEIDVAICGVDSLLQLKELLSVRVAMQCNSNETFQLPEKYWNPAKWQI